MSFLAEQPSSTSERLQISIAIVIRGAMAVAATPFFAHSPALVSTGTFIDRFAADDVRVVSYNVLFETIFPDVNPVQADKFARVVQALDPDVLNIQEVRSHSAADVVELLNNVATLPDGATWFAHQGDDNVIASKYPLTMLETNTNPPKDGTALALVDLPDSRYGSDFYVMNNHFTCCNETEPPDPLDPRELSRQWQADALVNWMRDARNPGEFIDLARNTPMLVVGDLNIINEPDVLDPLGTLLSGDIFHEDVFGTDSPPDWDGTPLDDAHPLHNARGPEGYTWRNDNSPFDPGRLDYILYTDSVLGVANNFILNTIDMTPSERASTGLQPLDITVDDVGINYDHLPLVTDFRLSINTGPAGDYNNNGMVDAADYALWLTNTGASAGTLLNDVDGGQVGLAQYHTWKANVGSTVPIVNLNKEARVPEPTSLFMLGFGVLASIRRQRN